MGSEYFISKAKKMKEKMPTGALQFKCAYDCGYILNDDDILILGESCFLKLIEAYDVIYKCI